MQSGVSQVIVGIAFKLYKLRTTIEITCRGVDGMKVLWLALALMVFALAGSVHAVVHEYNLTGVSYASGAGVGVNLINGNFTIPENINSTILVDYVSPGWYSVAVRHSNMMSIIVGNMTTDARRVVTEPALSVSWQAASPVALFVVSLTSGNWAIFNITVDTGAKTFDMTIQYQDDGTALFTGTIPAVFDGNYRYLGLDTLGYYLDTDFGYVYYHDGSGADIRMWQSGSTLLIDATGNALIGEVSASFADADDGCFSQLLGTSTFAWSGSGTSYCAMTRNPDRLNTPPIISKIVFNTSAGQAQSSWAVPKGFVTGLIQGTDMSMVYFSFKTMNVSSSVLPNLAFAYNANTGRLDAYDAGFQGQSAFDNTNNLQNVDCSLVTYGDTLTVPTVNGFPSQSTYNTYCFNLSSVFYGNQVYGAIKVINNTNVRGGGSNEFDFYWALYGTALYQFANIQLVPDPPVAGRNLTISWTTSRPTTTGLVLSFTNPATHLPQSATLLGSQSLTTSHLISVSGSILFSSVVYTYQVFGTDSNSVQRFSDPYTFVPSPFQETIADILAGVTIIVQKPDGNPLPGASVIFTPFPGSQQVYNINQYANATLIRTLTVASYCGTAGVCPDYLVIGSHNVTVSAEGYTTQMFELNVTSQPFFRTVTMFPNATCEYRQSFAFNNTCANTGTAQILESGQNWVCVFNPQRCVNFDLNGNPVCSAYPSSTNGSFTGGYGAWDLLVMSSNTRFASLEFANATIPLAIAQTTNAGVCTGLLVGGGAIGGAVIPSIVPTIANTFGALLGISASDALAFLAIVITVVFSALAGIASKEGVVAALVFFGLVLGFTFSHWLPLWLLIVVGVIVAFLVAQFVRRIFTPH